MILALLYALRRNPQCPFSLCQLSLIPKYVQAVLGLRTLGRFPGEGSRRRGRSAFRSVKAIHALHKDTSLRHNARCIAASPSAVWCARRRAFAPGTNPLTRVLRPTGIERDLSSRPIMLFAQVPTSGSMVQMPPRTASAQPDCRCDKPALPSSS